MRLPLSNCPPTPKLDRTHRECRSCSWSDLRLALPACRNSTAAQYLQTPDGRVKEAAPIGRGSSAVDDQLRVAARIRQPRPESLFRPGNLPLANAAASPTSYGLSHHPVHSRATASSARQ